MDDNPYEAPADGRSNSKRRSGPPGTLLIIISSLGFMLGTFIVLCGLSWLVGYLFATSATAGIELLAAVSGLVNAVAAIAAGGLLVAGSVGFWKGRQGVAVRLWLAAAIMALFGAYIYLG